MGKGLQISYTSFRSDFKIVLPDGREAQRSEAQLLKHGGIVGDNTRHLIRECKAEPGKVITARFTGA